MPPKKDNAPKKPTAAKTVEDKTFGMKNKKGSTAKKQIAQIQSQAASAKTPEQKRKEAEKAQREREKAASEAAKRETAELFKPVQVQKVPFGVDPKTVLCMFYKQGNCEKGKKCKFSHDPAVERKGEKRNLYQDTREKAAEDEEEEQRRKKDDMADWDEDKLRQVVRSKHGNPKTTTEKVCKYFIEAVENGKYGWFWQCPNGGDKCMYKHSLPPGFVFPSFPSALSLPLTSTSYLPPNLPSLSPQLHPQNQRPTRRRKSPHGQIPPQNPHPRRLPRVRAPQALRRPHARHARDFRALEEGKVG
ncbi:MAG: hypothetical protein Q9219_004814 [cf. Caloplaca sp. 3 TL-2023]